MADFTRPDDKTRTREEIPSAYIPHTVKSTPKSKSKSKPGSSPAAAEESEEDPLVAAMRKGMEDASITRTAPKPKKETGARYSMLAAIAEDADLTRTYTAEGGELTPRVAVEIGKKSMKGLRSAVKAITKAQNISLVFLLDTTGSMAAHMGGVKDQIATIVKDIKASSCTLAGVAFVGYKDWCDGPDHFEIFNFSKDISGFSSFISKITATGGGDYPEDVLGGLDRAINALSWPDEGGTKIIFHLADAPPHGNPIYHDHHDDYASGHPSDPSPRVLFGSMQSQEIMYFFGRINGGCDKMLEQFEMYYGAPIEVYDTSNAVAIADSVSSAVRSSVAATSARVGSSSAPVRPHVLSPAIPDWKHLPEQKGTYCSYDLPETMDSILKFDRLDAKVTSCTFKVAPNPFAKGAIRLAYYAQAIFKSTVDDVIFKEMITLCSDPTLDRMRYMVDMEVQTVAGKIAFEFNDRLGRTRSAPGIKLKFLMAKVLRIASPDDKNIRFMMVEKKYRGADESSMIKYTNNWNYVLADPAKLDATQLATAFSHFSYQHTRGYCMVCDIQGIDTTDHEGRPVMLLTDPAIHCPSVARFGKTNLQEPGIAAFFDKHICNKYCNALGLKRGGY